MGAWSRCSGQERSRDSRGKTRRLTGSLLLSFHISSAAYGCHQDIYPIGGHGRGLSDSYSWLVDAISNSPQRHSVTPGSTKVVSSQFDCVAVLIFGLLRHHVPQTLLLLARSAGSARQAASRFCGEQHAGTIKPHPLLSVLSETTRYHALWFSPACTPYCRCLSLPSPYMSLERASSLGIFHRAACNPERHIKIC